MGLRPLLPLPSSSAAHDDSSSGMTADLCVSTDQRVGYQLHRMAGASQWAGSKSATSGAVSTSLQLALPAHTCRSRAEESSNGNPAPKDQANPLPPAARTDIMALISPHQKACSSVDGEPPGLSAGPVCLPAPHSGPGPSPCCPQRAPTRPVGPPQWPPPVKQSPPCLMAGAWPFLPWPGCPRLAGSGADRPLRAWWPAGMEPW